MPRPTLLIFLMLMSDPALPDFDSLWDYNSPAATEAKFRELLPAAESSGELSYRGQLLTQIARTQGLQGRFDEAHATLDSVERMPLEQLPLARVRYLLERGRTFNSSGKPDHARPLFETAFEVAVQNGLESFAIDAAHMIAIVEPLPDAQLRCNLRALELAEKSKGERARKWRASLYNNIGWAYFDQKQFEKAMEMFEKAVVLREQAQQPRELRIGRYCVAKTLRMQGRIDAAMAIDRELVEQADRAGEPDGYFLEELAECLLALGKADEAKRYFRRALEALSKDKWLVESEPDRVERMRQQAESD